jgi:hypothetical protein
LHLADADRPASGRAETHPSWRGALRAGFIPRGPTVEHYPDRLTSCVRVLTVSPSLPLRQTREVRYASGIFSTIRPVSSPKA